MEKSLNDLPKSKQEELKQVVVAIFKTSKDIEKIILFGSYARGDYKEKKDLKPDAKSGHVSDYDILIVTGKKESIKKFTVWSGANKLKLSAIARVEAIDIQALNIGLAEGQYFFSDIKKEGIILFDSGKYKLANKRRLKPPEKQRIAQDYFEHWYKSAQEFFKDYENAFKRNSFPKAAFELHQATEHSYKTMLLVCTSYNPQEHYLGILQAYTNKFNSELKILFPKKLKADKDRFEKLDEAYIGGRYDPEYHISKKDLQILTKDVKKLLKLTKEVCNKKIKSFTK